jgi:hypothetical protein
VIRSLTKTELRDEEIGAVDLPSNTSKREMYELQCFNCGWTVKSHNKGRYPKVVGYKRRKVDNMVWQADMESFEVCYWWSFRNIWKEHCSNIRIAAHVMTHMVNVQYFEMLFVIVLPSWERLMMMSLMENPSLKSNQPLMTKMAKHFLTRMISRLLLLMMLDVLINASIKNGSLKPMGYILPRQNECVATSKRQQSAPNSAAKTMCHTRTLTMYLYLFSIMRKTCRCHITAARSSENIVLLHLDNQSLWDC